MNAFVPTRSPPPARAGSGALRFGSAVGLGAAGAFVCTLPATMRVAALVAADQGIPRVWVALMAAALGPMIAAVLVLRGAREGLKAYAGPGAGLRAFGVALWLAFLLVAFALFGSVLRATTHQHALAGVTFAFGALVIASVSALFCARIVVLLGAASVPVRRAAALVLALVALAGLGWIGIRFARAVAQDPASAAAGGTVLDVLAFTLAAIFGARPSLVFQRSFALVGFPVAVIVAVLGVFSLRDAALRDAIDQRAPAYAPAVDLLGGR